MFCSPPEFSYHLFLGKTLIFRLWLHYNFFSRTNLREPLPFPPTAVCSYASLTIQDNIALCWQLVFFGSVFLLQLNPFPDLVHHTAAQTHVLAQHMVQCRSGNNDQERMGSQALPGCSATIDVILALICFLFSTQDKLKKH